MRRGKLTDGRGAHSGSLTPTRPSQQQETWEANQPAVKQRQSAMGRAQEWGLLLQYLMELLCWAGVISY